jgi:hypothetical protein
MIDPFKNLQLNLHAAGPAAVLCVLFISIAFVGVFGQGALGGYALGLLGTALSLVGATLALRA